MTTSHATAEADLLAAARSGDDRAFGVLVERYRRELLAHCYRMTGSAHDADDALQDTLLRAWKGVGGFAGRSSLRTWLHTIATNACLALVDRRRTRALPVAWGDTAVRGGHGAASEPAGLEPWPHPAPDHDAGAPAGRYERRESVELAFVVAVQHLPPSQRAVLLLCDVLAFRAREAAEALGTSVASVTSALQRARATMAGLLPERSQQATLRALGDERLRTLVESYVRAWEASDADAILALLAADATFSMPPRPERFAGRAAIAAFLPEAPLRERWRVLPARANEQLAMAFYVEGPEPGRFRAHSLDLLTLSDGGLVTAITAFLTPGPVLRLGQPAELGQPAAPRERG